MQQAESLAVRQSVVVGVPPERAFEVFTRDIGTWWPLESYTLGAQPAVTAVIEPRSGGRWFERAADGSECPWGRVVAYEPPHRLLLTWEISCDWQPDASARSEVEVRFHAHEGGTRVELEHRGLETYGDRAQQMRDTFGSPEGWGGLLAKFAAVAG
ncbi:MAG TPA: SRPBCC family protein [Solirubrobacteraceae bacterium]|nr:SRPBCC family protein [Solirubrobacteraceae bacterium]